MYQKQKIEPAGARKAPAKHCVLASSASNVSMTACDCTHRWLETVRRLPGVQLQPLDRGDPDQRRPAPQRLGCGHARLCRTRARTEARWPAHAVRVHINFESRGRLSRRPSPLESTWAAHLGAQDGDWCARPAGDLPRLPPRPTGSHAVTQCHAMIGKPRALRRLDLNCGAYMIGNGNSDIGCLCQWFVLARPMDQ